MPRRELLVSRLVRFPRRSCSSSKALNSALKLPAPKPWSGREKKVSCGPRESQPYYPSWRLGLVGASWYLVIVALDDFQEERGPILHGLGEDLQEVAFLVVVYQDFQLLGRRQEAELEGRLAHTPTGQGGVFLESPRKVLHPRAKKRPHPPAIPDTSK